MTTIIKKHINLPPLELVTETETNQNVGDSVPLRTELGPVISNKCATVFNNMITRHKIIPARHEYTAGAYIKTADGIVHVLEVIGVSKADASLKLNREIMTFLQSTPDHPTTMPLWMRTNHSSVDPGFEETN